MTKAEVLQLKMTATRVRMGVIEATHSAKSGHPGGSLSAADVLTYLYFKVLNVDTENPQDPTRDRFVLSKGHAAPALYSVLAERGFFPVQDLTTLRHDGSYLEGHPNMNTVPGVDMSTGSLGQGVSAACGMALAARPQGLPPGSAPAGGFGFGRKGRFCRPAPVGKPGFHNKGTYLKMR